MKGVFNCVLYYFWYLVLAFGGENRYLSVSGLAS